MGLSQGRSIALQSIPKDATAEAAAGWLIGQYPHLSKADRDFIVDLHMNDFTVKRWRMDTL